MKSLFKTAIAATIALGLNVQAQDEISQTLIRNVNVWDGFADKLSEGQDVLIEGNSVAQIGRDLTAGDATVINGGGRTLMPGLIDMHTHVMFPRGLPDHENVWDGAASGAMAHESMQIYMNNGFTTLRDMCSPPSLSRAISSGSLEGPRFYTSGACISSYSAHADWGPQTAELGTDSNHTRMGTSLIANSPDEYREAARYNFRQGAQFLKIFVGGGVASSYDPLESITIRPEELKAAVEVAEDFGSYACIHVYQAEHIQMALDQGVTCIEHGFLMDEATMKRMVKEDIVLSAQAFMSYTAFQDPAGIPGFGPEQVAKGLKVNKGADQMFKWASEKGVDMFAGSDMYTYDALPNAMLNITQLERWFTPVEALRAATSSAGKWLMKTGPKNPYKDAQLGTLKEGSYADVILVDGNPLEGTEVLVDSNNVVLVMKDGKIFKNQLD
ncbi:MAG: amidohydrolase family protein [Halioglobus sp.]